MAPNSDLSRVLVLGAGGDIGGAIADTFAVQGYDVERAGRDRIDLASKDMIDAFFATNGTDFDIVVHSAGLNKPKIFSEQNMEEIRQSIEVNLFGFLRVMKHVAPAMMKAGHGYVLAISSLYGFLGRRGRLSYVVSKHGLIGTVKTLAIELGPHGVLVNALSPGYVATKMTRANNSQEVIRRFESQIPLGRLASPQDIADVAYFLCSPQNRYINGQDIVVDGGFSIGGFQDPVSEG